MSYQFGHVDPDERLNYAEEPPPEEEYRAPRRILPGALLAMGVMAVFAGGLWFAYHEGVKHAETVTAPAAPGGQVPLIRADTNPVKVRPEKAGGMNIPGKDDPIYSMRPDNNPVEKLLPPPEAPAPRPVAPPPAASPVAPSASAIQPGPAPLPAPPQVAALPKPATKPAPKPAEPAVKPAAGTGVRIQLASLRTPEEARDEWTRVKRANADLLGKLTAIAVRDDLGDRGVYYRVEVGPVDDRGAAVRLCKALKERGLECQLVQ